MMDLDQAIDQSYRDASEAENVARRLEARTEQIPGAKGLLPSRKYGTPVNFKAIQENLTLASLISRSDAAPRLAMSIVWLGSAQGDGLHPGQCDLQSVQGALARGDG